MQLYTDQSTGFLRTDGEDEACKQWIEDMELTEEILDVWSNAEYDSADVRSIDGKFWGSLLRPREEVAASLDL